MQDLSKSNVVHIKNDGIDMAINRFGNFGLY